MMWDLGVVVMTLRILREKLILYHHFVTLPDPDTALAKKFLKVQHDLHLHGIKEEVKIFLAEFEVYNVSQFSKQGWKTFVREKIVQRNRTFLLEEIKQYKKLDYNSLALEEFGLKQYFLSLNLADRRLKFQERNKCMFTRRSHFPSDRDNIRESFQCVGCETLEIDQLSHWFTCNSFPNLRKKIKPNDDKSIVELYRSVINQRQNQLNS